MALARMRIPEDRLKQLLSEATDSAVYNLIGIAHADIPGFRRRLGVPNSWTRAAKGWLAAVGRVVLRRWRDWEEGIYPEPIDQEELKALVERELNGAPPDPREVPGRPALTPQQLLVEIRRWFNSPEGHGHWPTIAQLAQYLTRPPEVIQDRVDVLLDRRMVEMEGEQVVPSEAKASPLIVRQMTEEERVRYGPPGPIKRRERLPPRPIGLFPESDNKPEPPQEVQEEMPTGKPVPWPDDADFDAEFRRLKSEGFDPYKVFAESLECSVQSVRKHKWEVDVRLAAVEQAAAAQTTQPQITPHAARTAAALAPEEAGQGVGSPEPDPAAERPTGANRGIPLSQSEPGSALTDENIEKLGRIAQALAEHGMPLTLESVEVREGDASGEPPQQEGEQTGRLTEEELLQVFGPEEHPRLSIPHGVTPDLAANAQQAESGEFQTAVNRMKRAIVEEATLATHATLILIDESADRPAQVRVVHEHLTEAPEQFGDQWGEAIRVQGRRTIRIWTCVGRLEVQGAPLCVMLPLGVGLYQVESRERGVA